MKVIINLLILFLSFQLSSSYSQEIIGDRPLSQKLIYSIVQIFTSANTQGTGFLIAETVETLEGKKGVSWFLATNKHMIGEWSYINQGCKSYYDFIDVVLYTKELIDSVFYKKVRIDLKDTSATQRFIVHPDTSIDVAVILINNIVNQNQDLKKGVFHDSYLMPYHRISSGIGIGDQVFVLGYPKGITSLTNNFPIAKSGYISSIPGEIFSIDISGKDKFGLLKTNSIKGKILLIDGLIVKGNSGGPVILSSVVKTYIDSTGMPNWSYLPSPNPVIGILSGSFNNSGISIVYSSDYILEILDEFNRVYGWNKIKIEYFLEQK